jgi:hypothetical protein
MPQIEITPEQERRLRALQEQIAEDVVGKYGHVRPRDAVEYLLDRYDEDVPDGKVPTDVESEGNGENEADDADDEDNADDADDETTEADGGDDAMLDRMMNLLDTHDDKWGEASGDERYAVELPDGSTESVRTKDDVKALLFEHYR